MKRLAYSATCEPIACGWRSSDTFEFLRSVKVTNVTISKDGDIPTCENAKEACSHAHILDGVNMFSGWS
jgi:hypothetical protein